ncbi:MAG: hypothetical protein D8M52_08505 [Chlorobi bacterium]|nr:MAG: hypothetical protein UZ06_CHB003000932 [Chlorobi bacterium OLB6]MBL1161742.1 hypothetical protein [Chlorobiota bacterium]NOG68207.1 hypothetical protein [Chlorobiota bacterium]QOJ25932.1 MAG: hypothetical protein HRU79_04420 [Ignavibacteria bacterium]
MQTRLLQECNIPNILGIAYRTVRIFFMTFGFSVFIGVYVFPILGAQPRASLSSQQEISLAIGITLLWVIRRFKKYQSPKAAK